jgi:hypothetical protein
VRADTNENVILVFQLIVLFTAATGAHDCGRRSDPHLASQHVAGNAYAENDLLAARHDLETIQAMGLRIVPVARIVAALLAASSDRLQGCIGLTLDDGSDFDARDLPHPTWGVQRGFLNVLRDFRATPWPRSAAVAARDELRDRVPRRPRRARPHLHDRLPLVEPRLVAGSRGERPHGSRESRLGPQPSVARAHGDDGTPGAFEIERDDEAHAEIGRACELLRELRGRGATCCSRSPTEAFPSFLVATGFRARVPRSGYPAPSATLRPRFPRLGSLAHSPIPLPA